MFGKFDGVVRVILTPEVILSISKGVPLLNKYVFIANEVYDFTIPGLVIALFISI